MTIPLKSLLLIMIAILWPCVLLAGEGDKPVEVPAQIEISVIPATGYSDEEALIIAQELLSGSVVVATIDGNVMSGAEELRAGLESLKQMIEGKDSVKEMEKVSRRMRAQTFDEQLAARLFNGAEMLAKEKAISVEEALSELGKGELVPQILRERAAMELAHQMFSKAEQFEREEGIPIELSLRELGKEALVPPSDKFSRPTIVIFRLAFNGGITTSMIAFMNTVTGVPLQGMRMLVEGVLTSGGINAFFQFISAHLYEGSFRGILKNRTQKAFPLFTDTFGPLFRRSLKSLLVRAAVTAGPAAIYALVRGYFTGVIDFNAMTGLFILANMAAGHFAGLGSGEMAGWFGPKWAEGLPGTTGKPFQIQTALLGVWLAALLQLNNHEVQKLVSPYMEPHVLLGALYAATGMVTYSWWQVVSRWTNPYGLPARELARLKLGKVGGVCADVILLPATFRDLIKKSIESLKDQQPKFIPRTRTGTGSLLWGVPE